MPRLIIGHVETTAARLWVRGARSFPVSFLEVLDPEGNQVFEKVTRLEERHFYTAFVEVDGLAPSTRYDVQVAFGPDPDTPPSGRTKPPDTTGTFRTFPEPEDEQELSFLLVSCNLHSLGVAARPGPAYERLGKLVDEEGCDFMIHCGDQIYYDLPIPTKSPSLDEYRDKYLDAWNDCKPMRKLLTRLPHYMILDDHEIRDNFRNDMKVRDGESVEMLLSAAGKVYREFQHIHNPQTYGSAPLYYHFAYGSVQFFVLDCRTERYGETPGNQMIDDVQMQRFREWLLEHEGDLKFVVTSIPFVSEPRNSDDKWSSPSYVHQKKEILEFLLDHQIERLVFLTGDMHNSHHAEMDLSRNGTKLRIHELMSSPVNQLRKNTLGRYLVGERHDLSQGGSYVTRFPKTSGGDLHFYTGHSNAMVVQAKGDRVSFEIYRTKRDRPAEFRSWFQV